MSRKQRIESAKQTVAICEAGFYRTRDSRRIDLAKQIQHAVAGTVLYSPENMPNFAPPNGRRSTKFEVRNETTISALRGLAARREESIVCLNFASARNPGGGFLTGAQAQEESLARASALYPCLHDRSQEQDTYNAFADAFANIISKPVT
jgi:uncharacterized protein (TIGR02452 family)